MDEKTGPRLWAVLMTGIPYVVFKIGAGWYLYTSGRQLVGGALIVWGGVDLVSNLVSLLAPRASAYCLLAEVGRKLDGADAAPRFENLGLAVDTLVTLVIVSAMIWFGAIPALPATLLLIWNIAVVANITAVGVQRVWLSARELK